MDNAIGFFIAQQMKEISDDIIEGGLGCSTSGKLYFS